MAVTLPYYEFREVLSVRDADAERFQYAGRSARADASARSAARSPTRSCCAPEREHGLRAVSYDDDVHPYSDLVIGRVDAVLLDNVLAERRHRTLRRLHDPAADGRHRPLRRRARARRTRRCATHRTRLCWARCATARSSASSGNGRSGTTISRELHARLLAGEPVPPVIGLDESGERRRRFPVGRRPGGICRRFCARRSSRWCCRACRWGWRSCSAC